MPWHVIEAWEDNVKEQGRLKIAHNCYLNSDCNHSSSDESWKGKQDLPWAENVNAFTPLLFTGSSGPALAKRPTLCMDSWHYSEGVTREHLYRNAKPLYRLPDRQLEIQEKTWDWDTEDLGGISSSATNWLCDLSNLTLWTAVCLFIFKLKMRCLPSLLLTLMVYDSS